MTACIMFICRIVHAVHGHPMVFVSQLALILPGNFWWLLAVCNRKEPGLLLSESCDDYSLVPSPGSSPEKQEEEPEYEATMTEYSCMWIHVLLDSKTARNTYHVCSY